MDEAWIKTSPNVKLKPNGIFSDVNKPFFYQRRGALLMVYRPRMVLGDDVGLGKTLQMILASTYLRKANQATKLLVFTEKTALRQWQAELRDLAPTLKSKIITVELYPDPKQRIKVMRNPEADVVLTNYNMLYRYARYLKEGMQPRFVVVFDEPDLFKNTETEAHTQAFDLANGTNGAARTYGMTATIVGNRLDEAFGIMRVVAPGTIPSRKYFDDEFCVFGSVRIEREVQDKEGKTKIKKTRKKVIRGYKNLEKFRELIEPAFFGRKQDHPEVKQDLPEVITKDVEITLSEEQSRKVLEAEDKIFTFSTGETKQLQVLPALTLQQQMTNDPRLKGFDIPGAKTEALIETINGSLKGQRVVIFSKFRSCVDLLEAEIKKTTPFPVLRITGNESWDEKEAAKNHFMSDEGENDILLLTRAGKRAINLQRGGHLFFYDLPWAYDDYRQVVGRLKRTGSTFKTIGVYRMMGMLHPNVATLTGGEQTIDHHTLGVVMEKLKLFEAVTGSSQADSIAAGTSDIMDIFDSIKKSRRTP